MSSLDCSSGKGKMLPDIVEILEDDGFKVVRGYAAVMGAIEAAADQDTKPLCSGYGVFPDGKKCDGCKDCRNPGWSFRGAIWKKGE